MSDVVVILEKLKEEGFSLWLDGEKLRYKAPKESITKANLLTLKRNKEEIIQVLQNYSKRIVVEVDSDNRYEPFPLTDVQTAYLMGRNNLFDYGGVACHVYLELKYKNLDVSRVRLVWNKLIQTHLVMCDTVDKLIEKITLESKNVVNIVGEEQLSLIQQSYWIGREQEFYGASNSTHLYLEVHHNLDLMKLEKVIRTLIKRHGALRSIIKEEKQFIFEEKIADTFCLETINIGREEKEKYFKKLRYNNQTRLRDLENWPLFDVKNICIDTCENFLLVRNNFLQLLQMSKKQRKNNLEYILFSERLDSEQKEYYMSLLDKESKKVEYAMMKRQKKFSIYVRKIPTLVIGSYNDQCVILQAVKDNAKIHTAELKIVDSVCHDMMLDPDWRNIADLIFKFIEKTIDKKSGDNYNDNYVSTQAHQGGE